MSHLIYLPPIAKPKPHATMPVIIRNQSLFDDFVRLANLYQMAFPGESFQARIGEVDSAVDAALEFFFMVEDQYFPLEHMWDWDDLYGNYEGTIRRWLTVIPVKVVAHDQGLDPVQMSEPKALIARLSQVGNYSDTANEYKQVLRCQYPEWEWDNLLDTFQISQVIEALDDMFLPPPFDRLPALIKYMTHESGTYFLDATLEEWPHYIFWSRNSIDWLKDDWEEARQIMDQSDMLCSFLKRNPEKVSAIWTILKVAHQRRST